MHKPLNMYTPHPYILLIDDDEDDLEMLSFELQKKGIRIKTFNSSTKALYYLTLMRDVRELPSFIIMDYNMPKLNGYEVLVSIKNNIDTKDIPVVIYSTDISIVLKEQLSGAGALHCLEKAWNTKDFEKQVQKFNEMNFSFTTNKN